ncbi:MAG TPA: DUF1080 domain-containing protein [Verrucomicrobiales bacterium]|nr:DUF1080 domain-containing protein [Verrucomicrobiales bacterium]
MFLRRHSILALAALPLLALAASPPQEEQGFVPMFNANDLKGWVNANCAPETWSIKDGVIACTGLPTGALRTEKQYENFILEAEWRHLSEAGNSGIFVWGTPISAPGVPFLRGIEVQVLDHGYMKKADPKKAKWFTTHGDVFPIHGATMDPHGESNGKRSFPSEERSKPSPEWNHYRIVVKGDHYQSFVNGVKTADFTQPGDPEGHIGFQVHGIKKGTGPYKVQWKEVKFKAL